MVCNGVVYTCKAGRERYPLFRTIDQIERTCLVIGKIRPSRPTLILHLLSTQDESNVTILFEYTIYLDTRTSAQQHAHVLRRFAEPLAREAARLVPRETPVLPVPARSGC